MQNHWQMSITCIGVPDNKIRRWHERAANAWPRELFIIDVSQQWKKNILKNERKIFTLYAIPDLLMSDHFSACEPHHKLEGHKTHFG